MRAKPRIRRCACRWWLVDTGPVPSAHHPEFKTWPEALEYALRIGSEATA